jgi:hypothetical protein
MPCGIEYDERRLLMIDNRSLVLAAAISAVHAGSALAAVPAEEAKKLGGAELTAWGAEKAGNKDGTIPAYTGERPKVPASYNPKEVGNMPDPYAEEKPLYSITAQNLAQHADKLTPGQKALFERYPNFRMDVYPTHRTTAYPQTVLDGTTKNATSCKAVSNGIKLENCYPGIPFPIPKNGNEAVWNHLMVKPAGSWAGTINSFVVDANGRLTLQGKFFTSQWSAFLDTASQGKAMADKDAYWKMRFEATGPARRVGEKTIIIDSLDPLDPGRRAWAYLPGQRRVKLAPDLSYDTPNPSSGGSATMDETQGFLGAQDRYDMHLLGKKEVVMMYNMNKWTDYKVCSDEVANTKNFPNPDCTRWELHRAWVIEAKLKPGFRHVYPRRVMYFDEDSWMAGFAENYDAGGKLYRVTTVPFFVWYFQPTGQFGDYSMTLDLQTGIWASTGGVGFPGSGYNPAPLQQGDYFSPEALAGAGLR